MQEKKCQDRYDSYLYDIKTALEKTGSEYYCLTYLKGDEQMCERMFAYEFYHQLRCVIDCKNIEQKEKSPYYGLCLNGEPNKQKKIMEKFFSSLEEVDIAESKNLEDRFIPDLVLHDPQSKDKQIYIAEIKLESNTSALEDLKKLSEYKEKKFGFYYYIYIYVGGCKSGLKSKLENLRTYDISKDFFGDIICFCAESKENVERFTLKELVDEIKKY